MATDSGGAVYKDGDVVNTVYGVGVIVASRKEDGFFEVRLHRIPGKSIGSSSLAILRENCFLGHLPAAPGMMTELITITDSAPDETTDPSAATNGTPSIVTMTTVLVQAYSASQNTYLVSRVDSSDGDAEKGEDSSSRRASRSNSILSRRSPRSSSITSASSETAAVQLLEVLPEQLQLAPSAKFYPFLETLMVRADATVSASTQLLQSDTAQRIGAAAGKLIYEKAETLDAAKTAGSEKLQQVAAMVEEAVPEGEENVKQVLTMIKDEELTVLLEEGKRRLECLVETNLPQATREALEKTGIHIRTEDPAFLFAESTESSRRAAISAIEELLQQAELDPADLDKVRGEITNKFTTAFDSLANVAKTDQGLNDIFESISEKTTVWQEQTGRLLQTRSASLFMEGASRLQARAAAIFGQSQFDWAGEIGSKLTKAFTEGDAALAKLKSIELGQAVKDRLVEAIEVRSESVGGLDGIIAGALATVQSTTQSGHGLNNLLTNLQQTASRKTADAHETLISVLSNRSMYQDVALLQVERVLVDLESHFGEDLTPDMIASIGRGEGGTAQLFEPIARNAMKQIDKQLDAAETQTTDETVLLVLGRVRKIMSGELSVTALMDELVDVLNDDRIVAAGETIVQHGEQVLDAIEGASGGGNNAVSDAIQLAEKAGITKDSVMRELEKLDVNDLLDTAGSAVTDEKARQKLLSVAIDVALDFVLRIIPSMPVPPFEGVNDGLVYFISNLSLEGFRVRKEDIKIEIAGMRATKKRRDSVLTPSSDEKMAPDSNGDNSTAEVSPASSADSADVADELNTSVLEFEEVQTSVKATELVIIDIRYISALLDNVVWSFEQTYLPYLKGNGMANVRLSDGAIRLQFELRRRRKTDAKSGETVWEPVLCLHDRTCSIGEVDLSLQGEGRLTWILNKLASIFKGPLRDYVVRTIVNVITDRSGWILSRLNMILSPYWELILRTARLSIDDLVEADDDVVVEEMESPEQNFVELVWRERLPLGMNLLLNDESGLLKVVDFPRGSQARAVCEKRNLDPDLFKGSQVVAVNGTEYDDQDDLFDALKDESRPKTVRFMLAESEDAERVRKFVATLDAPSCDTADNETTNNESRVFETRQVDFVEPGSLGIEFGMAPDNVGLVVNGMVEGDGGIILAAEKSGMVNVGDLLTHVNGELVISSDGTGHPRAVELLEKAASQRPLSLSFTEPYLFRECIERPSDQPVMESTGDPTEIVLDEKQLENGTRRIVVKRFNDVNGVVEENGILIGDHLIFINGNPVGLGAEWMGERRTSSLEEVYVMIKDSSFYPIALTFARPRQKESAWGSSFSPTKAKILRDNECDTFCVTATTEADLGCVFDFENSCDVVVRDFFAVPGAFQVRLKSLGANLSVDSINGQFVPTYASKDMVRNALNRSWKNDKRIEMCLCDDVRKQWVHSLEEAEADT